MPKVLYTITRFANRATKSSTLLTSDFVHMQYLRSDPLSFGAHVAYSMIGGVLTRNSSLFRYTGELFNTLLMELTFIPTEVYYLRKWRTRDDGTDLWI